MDLQEFQVVGDMGSDNEISLQVWSANFYANAHAVLCKQHMATT